MPREQRYATVEKECLAIKLGVETFQVYLLAVCEITACQRKFSRQKHCLSGHTDICMDKMSGQNFSKLKSKLLEIDNNI